MYNTLHRLINAKYSLPAWLWAMASTIFAAVVFTFAIVDPEMNRRFTDALPFKGLLWGPLLFLAGVTAMYGMARDKTKVVRFGAFVAFCLWVFGSVSWWVSSPVGWINVLSFSLWITVFWGYKFLASIQRQREGL